MWGTPQHQNNKINIIKQIENNHTILLLQISIASNQTNRDQNSLDLGWVQGLLGTEPQLFPSDHLYLDPYLVPGAPYSL